MAASRSSRVTRSSVGINGLDENFCGRTLRNRSIAQPEETSPTPAPRSRLPSKKQDSQQTTTQAKVAEGETSLSPRKRGPSVSEKDEPERPDVSERVRGRDASPPVKKAKRSTRSGESHGTEDEPFSKPASPDSAAAKVNDEDCKTDSDLTTRLSSGSEIPPGLDHDELAHGNNKLLSEDHHRVINGLAEIHNEDLESGDLLSEPRACPATPTNCPSLTNGSQAPGSTPDPVVPSASPRLERPDVPAVSQEAAESALSLEPELEVEVDVVGDSGQVQDQHAAAGGTNGQPFTEPPDPSDDGSNISGEPAGPAWQLPAEPPCFTEPQEHSYTLRTSPRPCRDSCVSGPRSSSPGPGFLMQEADGVLLEPDKADCEHSEHLKAEESAELDLLDSRVSRSTKDASMRPAEEDETEEEEPDVYYFESDHLALKHNKEYVIQLWSWTTSVVVVYYIVSLGVLVD